MFLKPLSKYSSCLSYIFMITFQPVTFISIYNTTLFGDMVLIFRCPQFILYSFTTLEMNLNAISFADVFEGFTKSFIIWNSYKVFMLGPNIMKVSLSLRIWQIVITRLAVVLTGGKSSHFLPPLLGTHGVSFLSPYHYVVFVGYRLQHTLGVVLFLLSLAVGVLNSE